MNIVIGYTLYINKIDLKNSTIESENNKIINANNI
jgi:hypothetical protein